MTYTAVLWNHTGLNIVFNSWIPQQVTIFIRWSPPYKHIHTRRVWIQQVQWKYLQCLNAITYTLHNNKCGIIQWLCHWQVVRYWCTQLYGSDCAPQHYYQCHHHNSTVVEHTVMMSLTVSLLSVHCLCLLKSSAAYKSCQAHLLLVHPAQDGAALISHTVTLHSLQVNDT